MCVPRVSEIAKNIGASPATVHRKIKDMEKNGLIRGYYTHLNGEKLGKGMIVIMRLQISYPQGQKMTYDEFIREYMDYFSRLKDVQEVYVPTGTWDLIIKLKMRNVREQYKFMSEKVMPLGNITRMESIMTMKTGKESTYIEPE